MASAEAAPAVAAEGEGSLAELCDLIQGLHARIGGVRAVSYTHLTLPTIYSV